MVKNAANKIARLHGVESVDIAKDGAINVILAGGINRPLREDVLAIAKRDLVPVRVFYHMPDDRIIGESDITFAEAIEDWYQPVHVPGFVGDRPEAPADEISKPDGGEKLKRLRAKTRGRPVVGWKMGDSVIKRGTVLRAKRDVSLAWTGDRAINVKAGSTAKVYDLATKRPLVYADFGQYSGVEIPIHSIGSMFDLVKDKTPKTKPKIEGIEDTIGYKAPELKRLINAIGLGERTSEDDLTMAAGFGNPPGHHETAVNSPYSKQDTRLGGIGDEDSSAGAVEDTEEPEEDMLVPQGRDPRFQKKSSGKDTKVLLGRR